MSGNLERNYPSYEDLFLARVFNGEKIRVRDRRDWRLKGLSARAIISSDSAILSWPVKDAEIAIESVPEREELKRNALDKKILFI
jgi:hypothetical protein